MSCSSLAFFSPSRTALRFAESAGHDEVACILKVDPAVCTVQEAAAAGRVHEVWALMRQASASGCGSNTRLSASDFDSFAGTLALALTLTDLTLNLT